MMNILITGATGFLGSRLVEYLAEKSVKFNILATGRKFSSHNKVDSLNVKYVLGDLENQSFVKSLFSQKIDFVINCASLSSPWGTFSEFYDANVKTQEYLIREAKSALVSRYIYISSPSIYFDFKDAKGISESDPIPDPCVNHYAQTKLLAENKLKESSLEYVILRPRALIGRGDTVIMPRLIRSHKEGKLKIMGTGSNRVDLTSVQNMVEAIHLALFTPHANEDYNISNGEPVKLWSHINSILEAIGLSRVTTKVPYWLLYSIAFALEKTALLIPNSQEPTLTRYSVGVLAKSFTFNITKAKEKLGYNPKQTTEEAMDEFIKWYKEIQNGES